MHYKFYIYNVSNCIYDHEYQIYLPSRSANTQIKHGKLLDSIAMLIEKRLIIREKLA